MLTSIFSKKLLINLNVAALRRQMLYVNLNEYYRKNMEVNISDKNKNANLINKYSLSISFIIVCVLTKNK